MGRWSRTVLGDVLGIEHGYAFKGRYFDPAGSLVLLTPKNFKALGGLDLTESRCKFYEGPVERRFVLDSGDVVVAMTDLKQDAPILGSAGTVPEGERYLHNQRIGKVKIRDGERLDRRFAPWLLNSPVVREAVRSSATGSTVRHTAPKRIEAVAVPLPPVHTQRRIAATLSAFDELVAGNKRRIALLEDLARSFYREWFVRFRHPRDQHSDRFRSELGMIPRDWTVKSLGEVAELRRQSVHPANDPGALFEHFSIPAFDDGKCPKLERGETIKSAKYQVDGPAVLLSKINPRISRVWLAHPRTENAIASTEFLVWSGTAVSDAWLWTLFTSEGFRGALMGAAGGTSTSHQRVKPGDIEGHRVPVPPMEVRQAFDSHVAPMLALAVELRGQNTFAAATMDLLLPRLVTGQLDISDIDLGVLTPADPE